MSAEYQQKILAVLAGPGGLMTRDVAACVEPRFGTSRMHSAFIRTQLIALQKAGAVRLMDNAKPDVWTLATTPSSQGGQHG